MKTHRCPECKQELDTPICFNHDKPVVDCPELPPVVVLRQDDWDKLTAIVGDLVYRHGASFREWQGLLARIRDRNK